jgi:hypothetical protein
MPDEWKSYVMLAIQFFYASFEEDSRDEDTDNHQDP